ncbi:hypothetical protein J2X98_001460 [Pseudarthrobacter enclensis]|uniref:Histone acetyltransferase Rv0428c-like C-terminal domain-containing protein n=1 Tax=Pseudarthrobacter enclensis TaxID=993070 RepID=A0ABT9RRL6_9MICC|nr:hypothetical protein [Pseudarthrobacter enclensis]
MSTESHIRPMAVDLENAMDAAWPALEKQAAGGWILRAAEGVTQRANSVWPRDLSGHSEQNLPALLREARSWYRSRRLPVIFQLFDTPAASALHQLLDAEGFTSQSETLVMTRRATDVPVPAGARPAVELSMEPSQEWLRVWWTVDGRGGEDALAVAGKILRGCPSLYALARDDDGRRAAVGRLALPAGSNQGGLYCMATLPEARLTSTVLGIRHRDPHRAGVRRRLLQHGGPGLNHIKVSKARQACVVTHQGFFKDQVSQ